MIKAIIIDDEKSGAEVLQLLLEQNCPSVKVIAVKNDPDSGIKAIQELNPDLVFLDIEMPTGTGFDVIDATKGINYQVVFTTAYEHYAIKAFKAKAVDYLLKPIDLDELLQTVKNVEQRLNTNQATVPGNLEEIILNVIHKNKKISIPSQEGMLLIDISDIIRLEAESNYTHFYLKDKRKVTVSKTLKSFEEQLIKNNFCRVHSTHLVNLNEVERYVKGDGGFLVLKDTTNIPVSRANRNELMERIN